MEVEDKDMPPLMAVPLAVFIALLYMAFVFKGWSSVKELAQLIPAFITTGISVGLFFSVLSLKRPLTFSFLTGASAPLLSALLYGLLQAMISAAEAGLFEGSAATSSPLLWMLGWFFAVSIAFGLISMLGCFLGLRIKHHVKHLYLSTNRRINNTDGGQVMAAKIGAGATVTASIVSAIVSIVVTSMGQG